MAKGSINLLAKVGSWAFIFGLVIAVLIGAFGSRNEPVGITVLVLLGLIVGFLNVTGRETTPFLLASVSLVIVSSMGGDSMATATTVGSLISGIFASIMTFVIPATIIVALKAIYALAHDE